jgi:hypothetical protein
MQISRHQNFTYNHNVKIVHISSENVERLKYLGTTVTDQILIHKKIKSRLNTDNACYHSGQKLLSFSSAAYNRKY